MAALKYSSILVFILTSCAIAKPNNLHIENSLSACISLKETNLDLSKAIPTAQITYVQTAPIGACGCKSAIANYKSFVKMDGYDSFLIGGKITFLSGENLRIPVAAQKAMLVEKANISLTIGCGNIE